MSRGLFEMIQSISKCPRCGTKLVMTKKQGWTRYECPECGWAKIESEEFEKYFE